MTMASRAEPMSPPATTTRHALGPHEDLPLLDRDPAVEIRRPGPSPRLGRAHLGLHGARSAGQPPL